MSRSLKRQPQSQRRGTAPRRKASVQKASTVDRMLHALPVSDATLRRAATWSFLVVIGTGMLAIATFFGVPQTAALAAADQIGKAGFRVDGIEVTGTRHMGAMTVYTAALDQQARAMPLVDVAGVRRRLLDYPWVADAQVSRRLPDKLVINIVERVPAAVWQNHEQLMLIDKDGHELERVTPDMLAGLPLLIGDGANLETADYADLVSAAPALKPLVRAATWIGNRRWNLLLQSGETLALPEEEPKKALIKFAELDGARSLLGKGWVRFDMRDPTRLVARKPGIEAQHAISDSNVSAGGGSLTTNMTTNATGGDTKTTTTADDQGREG